MTPPSPKRERVVVFSGSGVSAPSGLATFRSGDGIWGRFRLEEVATPEAWAATPEKVLEFYNFRREQAANAQPNAAHLAIAALERRFEVLVVTQNVDDLHERAGSTQVLHLHGRLNQARSSVDPTHVIDIGARPIQMGERCPLGSQLRPNIVWFGEPVALIDRASEIVQSADRLIVVGTSLAVYPAAGLVRFAPRRAHKVLVDPSPPPRTEDFEVHCGSADQALPPLVARWLA